MLDGLWGKLEDGSFFCLIVIGQSQVGVKAASENHQYGSGHMIGMQ